MSDLNDELVMTSEAEPSEADVRTVREGLLAFNVEHLGLEPRPGRVSLFLRNASGQVVGGLLGGWRWGWLYIDKFWIEDSYRGRGGGSRLLRAAEAEAMAAGCTDAVLETFSFQARGFYERHGYQVYATLEGFPPGHRQLFFHKRLVDQH
ncbi:MAG TPA: GNAT family N-acetyltransferase [Pyrinomonadaceae bacterium]|nr:GNAT family N-acetyltransferase [Pyrinomonadaceae bacterium]